jgi:hypothetical protein
MADGRFQAKQRLARPGRYYGDGGTIHGANHLDVETHRGGVVAVWFRCQLLPYRQVDVDERRAVEMGRARDSLPRLTGVEVRDDPSGPTDREDPLADWEWELLAELEHGEHAETLRRLDEADERRWPRLMRALRRHRQEARRDA